MHGEKMNKYSIILPVKNGGVHVKECVNSILHQTHTHFNLHVLDNCSTDGTGEWLQSLTDERIIYLPSAMPLTIEENWGRIKDITKNEFITLIGHDDILLPHYLDTMDQLIADYPTASLYQTHFDYIDNIGSVIKTCKPMPEKKDGPAFLKSFLTNSVDIMGTGFMMRSKDYDEIGGIPVHYPNLLFADMELWLKLTSQSYLCVSLQTCFQYRIHLSTTKTTSDQKLLQAFEQMVLFLEKFEPKNSAIRKVIELNAPSFIKHHCISFCHRLLKTDYINRNGISMGQIVSECNALAKQLVPNKDLNFNTEISIVAAKFIDSNSFLRKLFLRYKVINRNKN
jgi:glycosyltransferase involved in cell wall biosynthesis